jgi:hypothetical protein
MTEKYYSKDNFEGRVRKTLEGLNLEKSLEGKINEVKIKNKNLIYDKIEDTDSNFEKSLPAAFVGASIGFCSGLLAATLQGDFKSYVTQYATTGGLVGALIGMGIGVYCMNILSKKK